MYLVTAHWYGVVRQGNTKIHLRRYSCTPRKRVAISHAFFFLGLILKQTFYVWCKFGVKYLAIGCVLYTYYIYFTSVNALSNWLNSGGCLCYQRLGGIDDA